MRRVAALGLIVAACRSEGGDTAETGVPDPDEDLVGVVVVQVDTLRADRLAAWGSPRSLTPALDARPWQRLHGVRTTASWTFPSTVSFLTSLEPARSGLGDAALDVQVAIPPTWPALLRDAGWATGLFTGNPYLVGTGVEGEFSVSVLRKKNETGQDNLAALAVDALRWLDGLPEGQPFYLHLQPMDLHAPYDPDPAELAALRADPLPFSPEEGGAYEIAPMEAAWAAATTDAERDAVAQGALDVYDAQLPGLDRALDDLLTALASRGLLDRVAVMVTSDHGESLNAGGDGRFEHGYEWREELVNVPVLVLLPGGSGSRDEDCVASNVDLWPTLAAAHGLPILPDTDGIDLAEGCRAMARGSLWEDVGPPLRWVGVGDLDGALQRSCATGEEGGTPTGPDADPTETTPVEELPDGGRYRAAMDDALADLASVRPDLGCPAE